METTIKATVKPKRTWWRRVLKWVAVAGVLLFVGVLIWGWHVTRQLRAEITRIRDAGEPLVFKDLEAGSPRLEEDQDAGWYYNAALALVHPKGIIEALEPYWAAATRPASQPSAEQHGHARRILERNRLALEMFDRGAALPFGRFSLDMQYGMGPSIERLTVVRSAFKLLSLRTREAVGRGRADQAVESVISSFAALRVFRPQPAVIVHISGVTCRSLLLTDAQAVLNLAQLPEESLARLQRVVQDSWLDNEVERMVLADRVYGIAGMRSDLLGLVDEQAAARLAEESTAPSMPGGSWLNPIPRQLALGYLKDMDRLLQASRKPWPEIVAAMNQPDLARSTLGRLLVPSITRSVVLTGRSLAQVRCTAVAIMIRRHLITHGKLPDTLAELVPAHTDPLPADPFTGKSLIYKREAGGYVVYSVDDDLRDDGGRLERIEGDSGLDSGARVRMSKQP
ncbi:MAG TPA: hypothetical protein PKY77_02340 [Phycisphaerae bacterium]|nr:hypothetical protein [Phycisphaerae bacterium]HRY66582.1 hypothetical protein [Phycisphaerae bacterium]HSA27002.1 hypothetical protein [Phycisphaerae bacterium]